jgi:hypothetical protein
MASTYSDLKIELIGTGEQTGTWGTTTNDNFSIAIGEAITGSADVAFSSADVTVTLTNTNASQAARNLRLNLTGTSGGARQLILGSGCQIDKLYLINNGLADAVTVKNTSGTGIAVPAGKTMFVYNNGTNVVDAITYLSAIGTGVFDAGTVSAPSITFTGDTNTGIYSPAADTIGFTEGGVEGLRINSNGQTSTSIAGTASLPSFTRTGDENTGIFFPAADTIAFTEGGVEAMRIADTSNVGIGTTAPVSKFVVKTGTNQNFCVRAGSDVSGTGITLDCLNDANSAVVDLTLRGTNMDLYGAGSTAMVFRTNSTERMRIDASGNLLVGTTSAVGRVTISALPGGTNNLVMNDSGTAGSWTQYINTSGNFYVGLDNSIGTNFGAAYSANLYQGSAYPMLFWTNAAERMRITSAGNVGIGTASPTALLTVQKSQNTETQLQVVNADGGTAAAARLDLVDNASSFLTMQAFSQGYSGSFWGVTAAKLKVIFDNSAPTFSNGLILGTSGSTPLYFATAGTQRMIITSAGRLGVGTTSPAELLDSRGAAVFSGDNATATNNFGTASGILLSTASDNSVARITAVSNGNNSVGLSLRSLSSGNAVEGIRIAADGTITFTQTTLASYLWTSWSPTNLTGTVTNAPSTGTGNDSNYVTMANSSGTLTVTFDIAGKYQICINSATLHANVYSFDRLQTNLGGTATRQFTPTQPSNSGDPSNDSNFCITTSFYVIATAAQTLTILPSYELTGGGITANHVAYCNVTIQYCGA